MSGQYTDFRNSRPIAGVAIVGFLLATLLCEFDGAGAQGCILFDKTGWVGLEILRSLIVLTRWQAASAYVVEGSRVIQHLVQIGASLWPLLCAIAC